MTLVIVWGALALFLTTGVAFAAGIYGTYADEFVYGTSGDDFISAGAGSDEIYGHEGDDTIFAADDLYAGYSPADTISCGDGSDTVIVDAYDSASSDCEVVEYDLTVYPTS